MLFRRKESELPVQSARKFSAVFGTTFANSCRKGQELIRHMSPGPQTAKTAGHYVKTNTKHAAASFTTSNTIRSGLPPPIDMSMKT